MKTKIIHSLIVVFSALVAPLSSTAFADQANIAVAANFTDAAREVAKRFEAETGHTVKISYGSTGKLYAQIAHGAPFDAFLAADVERPIKAEAEGLAVANTRFIYAKGKLVLWSAEPGLLTEYQVPKLQNFKRIAIANPKTAPYGVAARQVMEHIGAWPEVKNKLVRGDSIAQTFQFVATENALLGFVANSQLIAWKQAGSSWEIPADFYEPIEQAAVLLEKGRENAAAIAFLEFLKSQTVQETIMAFGYGVDSKLVAKK